MPPLGQNARILSCVDTSIGGLLAVQAELEGRSARETAVLLRAYVLGVPVRRRLPPAARTASSLLWALRYRSVVVQYIVSRQAATGQLRLRSCGRGGTSRVNAIALRCERHGQGRSEPQMLRI